MKNIPQDLKDVIEVHKSMKELIEKWDYYENLDWLDDWECLDRLHEYRDKLFFILKKIKSVKTSDSEFEPVRSRIVNMAVKGLSWTEQMLVLLVGSQEHPSEDEYRQLCKEYVVEHAPLFYKLSVSDDYIWFMDRWAWVVDNIARKHLKSDWNNNHTKFLLGNEYKISDEDVEHLVWRYCVKDLKNYLCQNNSRFISDKKEVESKKKLIISELKEKYPNATWNCKSFLLSSRNWNALCEDFIEEEKQSILDRINKSGVLESAKNAFTLVVIISVFLNSYLESWILNKEFEDYIMMRTEEEFKKSEQKKLKISQQNESKSVTTKQPVIEHKSESKKKDLPMWMEDDIKNMDIIDVNQLIRFFKVELTNFWWHIKMSHLKDRLNRMSESESLPDVLALLDNYPEFIVEDDEVVIEEKVSSDWDSEEVEDRKETSSEELLLNKLFEVIDNPDIQGRLSGYIGIFEELWFKFKDKEEFLLQLKEAVDKADKWCLENSIQTALKFRIYGNESLSKKKAFWYRAICLNHRAWRIVLTNMEITHILPHDEYEKLINTKPSQK